MSTAEVLINIGYAAAAALALAIAWWRISRGRMPDEPAAAEEPQPVWDEDAQRWATVHEVGADAYRLLVELDAHLDQYAARLHDLYDHTTTDKGDS